MQNLSELELELRSVIIKISSKLFSCKYDLVLFAFKKITSETRYYHSWEHHIFPMLKMILENPLNINNEALMWATLYHDIVYNFRNGPGLNEKFSASMWVSKAREFGIEKEIIELVEEMILETYGHESKNPLVRELLKLDLAGFSLPFYKVLQNELLVRKEYAHVDWILYKAGRISFLKKFSENSVIKEMGVENKLLEELANLENIIPNIAIYPGTFNPFHKGHLDILKKAEAIFDKVIIVYAENPEKPFTSIKFPEELNNRQVEIVRGSLIKWIENLSYPVTIIRGLRNTSDVQYEQNYLRWLQELSSKELRVVNIFCDKENEHISSSALRALALVDIDKVNKFTIQ